MECDYVTILVAVRDERTLTDKEETILLEHLRGCAACAELTAAPDQDEWTWLLRVPVDALAGEGNLLDLPTVDPASYVWGEPIAQGGMGRILSARDRRLGRPVAVKEILSDRFRARFEREIAISARLQHPAIVPIYEAGQWPTGEAFYAM